jgi:hypothetical protein
MKAILTALVLCGSAADAATVQSGGRFTKYGFTGGEVVVLQGDLTIYSDPGWWHPSFLFEWTSPNPIEGYLEFQVKRGMLGGASPGLTVTHLVNEEWVPAGTKWGWGLHFAGGETYRVSLFDPAPPPSGSYRFALPFTLPVPASAPLLLAALGALWWRRVS